MTTSVLIESISRLHRSRHLLVLSALVILYISASLARQAGLPVYATYYVSSSGGND